MVQNNRVGSSLSVSLQLTYPFQERLATPTIFEQLCGFFYIPQEPDKCKCCEMGHTVFRPYLTILESLTIYRCHSKGIVLSPQLF